MTTAQKHTEILATFLKTLLPKFDVENSMTNLQESKLTVLAIVAIKPEQCGVLAPMLRKITLTIKGEYCDGISTVHLRYDYEHPSGSNGYTVTYFIYNDVIEEREKYYANQQIRIYKEKTV